MDSLHHNATVQDETTTGIDESEEHVVEALENIIALPLVTFKKRKAFAPTSLIETSIGYTLQEKH